MKKLLGLSAAALLLAGSLFMACDNGNNPGGEIEEPTLESISIKTPATKTTFKVGDDFSYEGLTLTAKKSDKSKETITEGFTVTLPEPNLENNKVKIAGANVHNETVKATVTYQEKTAEYDVTISEDIKKIELKFADTFVTTYTEGDDLDDETGISVLAFYTEAEDEAGEDVTASAEIAFTVKDDEGVDVEFTPEEDGEYTVTITATLLGKTATATKTITVEAAEDPEDPAPDFDAPDLKDYYKKYFVTTDAEVPNFGIKVDAWSSGSGADKNDDGSYNLTSAHMWNEAATEGVVAAFNGIENGILALYDWVVFTLDATDFTFTATTAANDGVNVQIPKSGNKLFNENWVKNSDKTRTYFIPISEFGDHPLTANQLAIIIGGSGTLVVKEIFVAAEVNPAENTEGLILILGNDLEAAKELLSQATGNTGNDAGQYSASVVDALSSAIDDAEDEINNAEATVESLNAVSEALADAVAKFVVNTYPSPIALETDVEAIAKVFVTDPRISGTQLTVKEYTQGWNGGWTTDAYKTSDEDTVKVVKFASLGGDNACGAWVFEASDLLVASEGKTLYVHFDYIAAAAFDINLPQSGDHWLTLNPEFDSAEVDVNGWKSTDISLEGIDMTKVVQFGWRSNVVQNVYVTNVYFYEK